MARFFPRITATGLQATTYLLGIALFSIAFLVFLNSSISFVITEVIGQKEKVGDAVGTLLFADELLALVACPLWGLLSDRIGLRNVAVFGYCIIGFSLMCLVQSSNLYPELLVGRLGFSVGGAACSTMVTAVLPAMVAEKPVDANKRDDEHAVISGHAERFRQQQQQQRGGRSGSVGHGTSPSVNSELTITPNRFASSSDIHEVDQSGEADAHDGLEESEGSSQLAGFVGFFTGIGALVALALFLPLPAYFQDEGLSQAQSVQVSFYIVGAVAFFVAVFIFLGLRNLPGEENKKLSALFHPPYDETTKMDHQGRLHTTLSPAASFFSLAKESLLLGFTDSTIALGYLGGFVARASSVGISSFIPLFVNNYFVKNGLCVSNPNDLSDIKKNCQRAYQLAAALTGIAEVAALLCAPLFGWLGGHAGRRMSEWPLLASTVVGVLGYVSFGLLKDPDALHGKNGWWAFISVILIGISQIGAIVCSLALLGRGINQTTQTVDNGTTRKPVKPTNLTRADVGPSGGEEVAPLLPDTLPKEDGTLSKKDRRRLRGSIAGMYSLAGGAGILVLTKLGGVLFDSWLPGAPFFLMAIFNAILFVAIVLIRGGGAVWSRSHRASSSDVRDHVE